MMDAPVYDRLITFASDDFPDVDLVLHLSPDGTIAAAHTPMNEDDIKCKICADGAKVYL